MTVLSAPGKAPEQDETVPMARFLARKFRLDGGGRYFRKDPSECRHLDCEGRASIRLITPWGTGNFCAEHGTDAVRLLDAPFDEDAPLYAQAAWIRECFRYGPTKDPEGF